MSDYRAIAAVTGMLQQFLYGALSGVIPGTSVRTGPPSASLATGGAPAVNVFLYQVNPNTSWRNRELPVRRSDGSLERRPQAALDLYYILSFYGAESKMVPQLLLGAAAAALHAHPILDPTNIPEFLDGKSLEGCGLAEQAQVLKFNLMPLSHEELGRIWSVFFQVPYTLSVAYQCSVVLLEADLNPEPAMPVLATRLGAAPWEPLRVERVEPPVVEHRPGTVVRIEGSGLAAPRTTVRFGELEAAPASVTAEAIEVELPAGLAAGVNTVRLVHREDETASPGARSNPASFVLLPRITGPAAFDSRAIAGEAARLVSVPLAPAVRPGQRVELLLNQWPPPEGVARAYQLHALADAAAGQRVSFSIDDVEPGDYLARIEVDGVASRLATDDDATSATFGRFIGPRIVIR